MGETTFSEEEMQVFRKLFDDWDGNKDGVIQKEEIGPALRAAGADPSEKEISEFMTRADTNNDGVVDFNEFTNMIEEIKRTVPKETLLREAFKVTKMD